MGPAHGGDEAGDRGQDGGGVAMGDHEAGVVEHLQQGGQALEVGGRFEHPPSGGHAPLQHLEHLAVGAVGGAQVGVVEPGLVAGHVGAADHLLRAELERHGRQALLVHAPGVLVDREHSAGHRLRHDQFGASQGDAGVGGSDVGIGMGRRNGTQQFPAFRGAVGGVLGEQAVHDSSAGAGGADHKDGLVDGLAPGCRDRRQGSR